MPTSESERKSAFVGTCINRYGEWVHRLEKGLKHGAMATPVQNGCGGHSCGPPLSATQRRTPAPPGIPFVEPVWTELTINDINGY